MTGKFIVFSGLDASGKSSNLGHVDMLLNSTNIQYAITREPGGTAYAERIRELIISKQYDTPALTETLMFYAARVDHTQKRIIPYLEKGYHVISDRYADSTIAYQSIICEETQAIHDLCESKLRKPDMTLLFDIPAHTAIERMERVRGHAAMDKIEQRGLAYFEKVRDNFLNIAKQTPSTVIIDATRPLVEVMEETWHHVKACIGYEEHGEG